jgi:hypothetical protein
MREVIALWTKRHPGLNVTMVGDNLKFHRNPAIVKEVLRKGCNLYSLAANTTAFTQPLDVRIFGVWDRVFKAHCERVRWATVTSQERHQLLMGVVYEIEPEVFTGRTIVAAFREAYLFPWRPADLLHRAELETASRLPPTPSEMAQAAAGAIAGELREMDDEKDRLLATVTPVRLKGGLKKVWSAEDLLALEVEAQQVATEKAAAKEQRTAERADAKVLREAKRQKVEEVRQARTCVFPGCTRQHRGSDKWVTCSTCNRKLCIQHANKMGVHECEVDGD